MTDHDCIQCGRAIGENTACLNCAFQNMETVMKEWQFEKVCFDGKEIKITSKKQKLTEVKSS